MAESSSFPELPRTGNDMLELNKDLERMIEDVENISVQLAWMAYDMVALRTSPELGASMRKLEEAFHRCRVAVCGDPTQEPGMDPCLETEMENTEREAEGAISTACVELENILRGLDSLSNSMDQLALRTHLRQCDLIVCVGHPDKLVFLKKIPDVLRRQPPPGPETEEQM